MSEKKPFGADHRVVHARRLQLIDEAFLRLANLEMAQADPIQDGYITRIWQPLRNLITPSDERAEGR